MMAQHQHQHQHQHPSPHRDEDTQQEESGMTSHGGKRGESNIGKGK